MVRSAKTSIKEMHRVMQNKGSLHHFTSKASQFANKGAIYALKKVPMYNAETGKFETMDTYATNLASNFGVKGSMGDDPIRTAYLMMIDTDYMYNSAKLIKDPNSGKYLTINEAKENIGKGSINTKDVNKVTKAYKGMRKAYESNDQNKFDDASKTFATTLAAMNKKPSYQNHFENNQVVYIASGLGGILLVFVIIRSMRSKEA